MKKITLYTNTTNKAENSFITWNFVFVLTTPYYIWWRRVELGKAQVGHVVIKLCYIKKNKLKLSRFKI